MLTHFTDEYSRVLRLVVVALLIPADTSECERVFSLMNDLKTSERNMLGQASLKDMMIWHTVTKRLECKEVPVWCPSRRSSTSSARSAASKGVMPTEGPRARRTTSA